MKKQELISRLKQQIMDLESYSSWNDQDKRVAINQINFAVKLAEKLDEPEKLYTSVFAPANRMGVYLYKVGKEIKIGNNMNVYDKEDKQFHLTEKEIKERDKIFWALAEEVKA